MKLAGQSGKFGVGRAVLYLTLAGATTVFLMPLVWLVVTSLKPIEQAMSLPPSFVPRAYHAVLEGERREVIRETPLESSRVVVQWIHGERAGRVDGLTPEAAEPELAAGEARALYRAEPGWWRVTEREISAPGAPRRWAYVPPADLEASVRPRWRNYPEALERMGGLPVPRDSPAAATRVEFTQFFRNTMLVCVLGVIGTLFSNAVAAYAFARLRWRGRDAFFGLTLATMMVPFPVLMVPLYGVFKNLGMIGTLTPLWLPAFFGSAFNIFLMRQFFRTIPEELSEAARIDGCSEWHIFWRIILPLSVPVLATAGVFHFLYAWNDFMGPLLFLTRKEDYTLALALQNYQSQHGGVQWHYLMAASAVTILPVIVLFFFAQRTFIQGIATTGSKA